ncbi:MAG: pyruvate dehydrogenase (acetyl-transferring) E1 component subunit alpha [Deinococcaceae bacterium]
MSKVELKQYVDPKGVPIRELPFGPTQLEHGYRALKRARLLDEKLVLLQRQGKIGVYPLFRGQEAAQVGAALALNPKVDWVVPSYRETAVVWTHGLPLDTMLLYWRLHAEGCRWPADLKALPFAISIGTQLTQAVGLAKAGHHLGDGRVVLTCIGDGGTSEGDFHEALNFASVMNAPVVFLVQNNGWAISVPSKRQYKVAHLSSRAQAYGIPGVTVDGNDLLAIWDTVSQAVERARAGEGPTLVEAVTYRVMPHTTSDDSKRYRDEQEVLPWLDRDPVERMRALMVNLNLWDDAKEHALQEAFDREITEAVRKIEAYPDSQPYELVEHVYAEMTPDQRKEFVLLGGSL